MALIDTVLKYVKLPPYIKQLRDYQVSDFESLAGAFGIGLWWDMGMGKTLMAILIGCYKIITGSHDKVLILCPESLIVQWCSVLKSMELEHLAYAETPAKRTAMKLDHDFIIMSYQIFQRDYERMKNLNAFIVVDEATLLCNPNNLFYKMINGGTEERKEKKILGNTGISMEVKKNFYYEPINKGTCLLAGIPVVKPEDWYGLVQTRSPGVYESQAQFLRLHVTGYDRFEKPDEYINLELLQANSKLSSSFRILSDHVELPPLVTKVIKYELSSSHMKLYKRLLHEKYIETKEGTIDALHASRLYNWAQRIILCPEKADFKDDPVGIELLDTLLKSQKHFLIFSKYVDTNTKIMNRYNIGALFGKISTKKKEEYKAQFKAGTLDGMTIHPKSGGFGLDLPEAKFLNFMELPDTPRDFFQCVARAYRQGQKDKVLVTVPYAAGTIQETLFKNIQATCDLMGEITKLPRLLSDDFAQDVRTLRAKTKDEIFRELEGG